MRTIFIILLTASFLFGATYTTISIDGTNDFDSGTERFSTTSGTTIYAYVTWDASFLYVGFSGSTPSGTLTDNDRVYHIYIDTDPEETPTNGTGTTDGEAWRWDPTLPFTANYHYAFKTVDNSEVTREYSGSWGDASMTTSNWKGSGYWELSIDRSTIGSPDEIYLTAYVEEDWAGGNICGGIPSNQFTNTTTSGAISFSNWLGFTLRSGETPNDAEHVDQALSVDLSSFVTKSSHKGVQLFWSTASETENQGFIISRQTGAGEWKQLASFADTKALEGQGSTSNATNYQYTDSDVQEGQTYAYMLSDVNYRGHRVDHDGQISKITYLLPNDAVQPTTLAVNNLYPNPFNPVVTMNYSMLKTADLNVSIYALSGERVWSHSVGNHMSGKGFSLQWEGMNDAGQAVGSGIYLVHFLAGNELQTRKVTLLR